jgi:hypothetical protein
MNANTTQRGSTIGISVGDRTSESGSNDRAVQSTPTVIRGVSVSGDSYSPSLVTSGSRATGAVIDKVSTSGKSGTPRKSPERRSIHKAIAIFATCLDQLDIALDEGAEFFARNNALEHFRSSLDALWKMRSEREEAFGDVINTIQAIFLKRRVEDFSRAQLELLRSSIERLQGQSELDDDFADSITLNLLDGRLDVFRELE